MAETIIIKEMYGKDGGIQHCPAVPDRDWGVLSGHTMARGPRVADGLPVCLTRADIR